MTYHAIARRSEYNQGAPEDSHYFRVAILHLEYVGVSPLPIHDQAANDAALDSLCNALDTKRMFAVAGAGLSNWAGYETWDAVLGRLADAVTAATGNPDVAADIRRFDVNNKLFQAQRLGQPRRGGSSTFSRSFAHAQGA
jgi:hypothetical protein